MAGAVPGLFRCGHTLATEAMAAAADAASGWLQADAACRDYPLSRPQLLALAATALRELTAAGIIRQGAGAGPPPGLTAGSM